MQDNNFQAILTPADFADTGQWRLIVYISRQGMRAFLKHISDKSRPMVEMLKVNWPEDDSSTLLTSIENAVYDHPGLLDDYATEIILESPKVCFAPNEIIDSEEDSENSIFSTVFPGEDQEVLSDRLPDCTALFTLARGLDGFISRTIPGARIRSHLAVIAERFRRQKADGPRIYVDIRDKHIDLLAFNNEQLLSASVQPWRTKEDILYRIFNLMNAYGFEPGNVHIHLSGNYDIKSEMLDLLRQYCNDVSLTSLPADISTDNPLPLAALLQAFRD